jgi:putative ABC transport system permease protein
VQLGIVAAVITVAFEHLGYAGLFLVVMMVAAAWTSGKRLAGVPGSYTVAATAISLASGVAMVVLFGTGIFDFSPRFLIPLGGMLIGNTMNATSLAGTRLRDEVMDKRLEIESRLALGIKAKEAILPSARKAAAIALLPTIDSTKNVGLIFLPGAFVGVILGGGSPAQAAKVQLIVMFMLLGAVAVAGVVATYLVARAFIAPGERIVA